MIASEPEHIASSACPTDLRPEVEANRVLVTGASGFSGRHCLAALHGRAKAFGIVRDRDIAAQNTATPPLFAGDISDAQFLRDVLRQCNPQRVVHLAGQTPARAPDSLSALFQTNVVGTAHLLDAIRVEAPTAVTLVVSSAAVYGLTAHGPVLETHPVAPVSAYGASKAAQEFAALGFGCQFALRIIRARTFNLVGPGEPDGLVCSAIARQIAVAECGQGPATIRIGRTDTARDFLDVRDAVSAYLSLVAVGRTGEAYNVCSGRSVKIEEILDRLVALSRIDFQIDQRDLDLGSPVRSQCGSNDKLQAATSWQPRFSLEQSLHDLLEWWRQKIMIQEPT
jgi:GDP-4-dehydro-6-deoxy-D-mannose reductase